MCEHKTLNGEYNKTRQLQISYVKLNIDNKTIILNVGDDDIYTSTDLKLSKGKYDFLDKNKNHICGAYYTYIAKADKK